MTPIAVLLKDLRGLLRELEDDLRVRAGEEPQASELRRAWEELSGERGEKGARVARTSEPFESWLDAYVTQVAVAWVLACVFVRYFEDQDLIDERYLAGPTPDELKRAEDTYRLWFVENPLATDREYLLDVFRRVGAIPAAKDLFAEGKTLIWNLGPGDAARRLRTFFGERDAETGALLREFATEDGDTRFLGDLYQDLSDDAKKRYALLQTPRFVEEFILDRTLEPAIEDFGLEALRLIDPACGSGHFLLGAFDRLRAHWHSQAPGLESRTLVQKVLDAIHGVDLNPFAVSIARFRLLIAALRASNERKLREAPGYAIHVAAGDSLLLGAQIGPIGEVYSLGDELRLPGEEFQDSVLFGMEEPELVRKLLRRSYHVVVGNPPYITVKDSTVSALYRKHYPSCHRKYSLGVPFTERFFGLAVPGKDGARPGYVGMITANSFMKREFGKKLIEECLPKVELTHVIDTSPANRSMAGHATPTVILFGRNRNPATDKVRAVLGLRSDPVPPIDPAQNRGWRSIVDNLEKVGAETEFVSVTDLERSALARHPWSIGGGGAAELKERLDAMSSKTLGELIADIGRTTHTGEDDAFYLTPASAHTKGLATCIVPLVTGDVVRDYQILWDTVTLFPYDSSGAALDPDVPAFWRHFWRYRTRLRERVDFGQRIEERGLRWVDHSMFFRERFRTPLSIAFAEVATHNHFILDRGGKVFKQTAPIIKLPAGASEEDHLALLCLLNSSTACFWLKQVSHCKGAEGLISGAKEEKWEQFFQFSSTQLARFPVVDTTRASFSRVLDEIAQKLARFDPSAILRNHAPSAERLGKAKDVSRDFLEMLIALQEELDWAVYQSYGLVDDDVVAGDAIPVRQLSLGQRAFEIVLARRIAAGLETTTWFERHGSTPITDLPEDWPEDYKALVERRIELIETDRNIGLIERPEYKRRWNTEPWEVREERALRSWLLDRLESERYFPRGEPELRSCARVAEDAARDEDFLAVAALYRKRRDFDLHALVEELVSSESVPFLPVLRYKDSGLRKRKQWEDVWELQRKEDRGDDPGKIPVPPKYGSGDFLRGDYWRLRGKLDVPKERWVSYPGQETAGDPSLVVAWAGWNHLEQARALAAHYQRTKTAEGHESPRLVPLLAGLAELVPWLLQWHNDVDPEFGQRLGEYFETYVGTQARELGLKEEDLREWKPPKRTAKARKKKS